MKKDQAGSKGKPSAATDNRVAQRHQKQSRAAQLSAANIEESPHMDERDSAGGSGESPGEAPGAKRPGESTPGGAVDTQYGTRSSMKTGAGQSGAGRASSGGSGTSGGKGSSEPAPNPGSSEASSGAERDTMRGPRPGSGS